MKQISNVVPFEILQWKLIWAISTVIYVSSAIKESS